MLACEFRRYEIVRDLAIHLSRRFRDHDHTFPKWNTKHKNGSRHSLENILFNLFKMPLGERQLEL